MLTNRRRSTAATVLLLAMVGLAGCGGKGGHDDSSGGTTLAGGLTAPGTTLKVGDAATVAGRDGAEVVELTVTSIDRGTTADLQQAHLANPASYTPYYVHYRLKLVSGPVAGAGLLDSLTAWSGDEPADVLTTARPFKPCPTTGFSEPAATGTTTTTCVAYLAGVDAPPVARITYDNQHQYLQSKGTNLTWK